MLKFITNSHRTFSSSTNASSHSSGLNLPDFSLAAAVQCSLERNAQDTLPAPAVLLEVVTTPKGTCSSLSPSSCFLQLISPSAAAAPSQLAAFDMNWLSRNVLLKVFLKQPGSFWLWQVGEQDHRQLGAAGATRIRTR